MTEKEFTEKALEEVTTVIQDRYGLTRKEAFAIALDAVEVFLLVLREANDA